MGKVKIFVLLLIELCALFFGVRSNPCRWLDDGLNCIIQCLEGASSHSISGFVQTVYDELDAEFIDCHSTGVTLILPKDVTGYTMRANWFQADIKIMELEIDGKNVDEFQRNVFASPVFATVKKLILKNVQHLQFFQEDIRNFIFDGLDALEDLAITDSVIKIYDNGMLDYLSKTLKSFVLTGMDGGNSINIAKFIGGNSKTLTFVEYVKIQYNLKAEIDYRSFTAIPNVKVLDLSDCNITSIGEFSFENLGSQLQILNLERNSLTTLPSNIFGHLHLSSISTLQRVDKIDSSGLSIRLNDNLWHCDCMLEHLKELLNNNNNFDGAILCTTPEEINEYSISETEFCPFPVTTERTTSTSTTTEVVTDPIDDVEDLVEKKCNSYNGLSSSKISMQSQIQDIRLNANSGGVSVTLDGISSNSILFWLNSEKFINNSVEYYQNANSSNCFSELTNPIHIKDLEIDTTYTFCLMNTLKPTVSPLNCISYYNQDNVAKSIEVWLYESSKPITICIIVVSCIANIIIGVMIGAMFLRFSNDSDGKRISCNCLLALQCGDKVEKLHTEAINPNFIDDFNSTIHPYPSFSTVINSNEITPPLPPHPLRDINDDDIYYTIVK